MSIFYFSNVLGTDSNIVDLLDVDVVQQRLSTVTFPEALKLCFPYVPMAVFFHACLCVFISDVFDVQTLNDDFKVFNCPEGAGWLCVWWTLYSLYLSVARYIIFFIRDSVMHKHLNLRTESVSSASDAVISVC